MKVLRVKYSDYKDRFLSMFKEHNEEVVDESLPLLLNQSYYKTIEDADCYIGIVCISDDDKPIGYISSIVYYHPHHINNRFCTVDAMFVQKEHRTSRAFFDMYKMLEKVAKDEYKVTHMQLSYSSQKDLSKLGKMLGFNESEIVMMKVL